ncbi:MAG: hypothetical protein ACI9F9_001162 [Candidatus Paceibacteria bacterium]|jgi:hypothetical protein
MNQLYRSLALTMFLITAPVSLAAPVTLAGNGPNGTSGQTCKDQGISGSACTVTYSVDLLPIPVDAPCAKVRISGTITCASTSCTFSKDVCAGSGDAVNGNCGGVSFEGKLVSGTWGGQARGNATCSNVAWSKES